jgi:DNA invertase Pin-like site-specific DNA recombinase
MTEDATRAVAFAAKSTTDTRGSIQTQLADCRALAEREGFDLLAEFSDEAASAYSRDRGPGLASALAECERLVAEHGEAALVVQHSDRLARGDGKQAAHLVEYALWGLKQDVTILSVQDPQTFGDLLYAVVTGQRNHEDSRRKALAVRDGLRRTFERGQRGGGPVPDGYELLPEYDARGRITARMYRHDPERAPIIRLAFNLYEDGLGDPSVARELNRRGYRTKGDRPWERRRIQDMLGNAFYAGRVIRDRGKPTEEVRDGTHPPLIEPERFDRLLTLRASRDKAAGSARSPKGRPASNHALAGLAICAACGARMRPITGTYRRADGSRRRTYQCANVHASTGLCDAGSVDAEVVDSSVIASLDSLILDFDAWVARIEAGHGVERKRAEHEVERAEAALLEQQQATLAIEADYERRLTGGQDEEAGLVLGILKRRRDERGRAEHRAQAAADALATVPSEAPADAMLDFYSELGRAVRGRLDGADTMVTVNHALRDLFARFDLLATPAGVLIRPVLGAAAAERIMAAVESWPHGLTLGGRPVEPWRDTAVVLGVDDGEDLSDQLLRPADPPALLADHAESIVPPLRPIETPSAKSAVSHA